MRTDTLFEGLFQHSAGAPQGALSFDGGQCVCPSGDAGEGPADVLGYTAWVRAVGHFTLVLSLTACVAPEATDYPSAELGLLILASAGSDPLLLSIHEEGASETVPVAVGENGQLFWVGGSRADFENSYPDFQTPTALEELELVLRSPLPDPFCARYGDLDGEGRLTAPLMTSQSADRLEILKLDSNTGAWTEARLPSEGMIHLSYKRAECLATVSPTLERFSDTVPEIWIIGAEPLGPNRALVNTRTSIEVLDRTSGRTGTPWHADALATSTSSVDLRWEIGDFALDVEQGGSLRVLVAAELVDAEAEARETFAIVALRLVNDGLYFEESLVEFQASAVDSRLDSVAMGPEGNWVAAGRGLMIYGPSTGPPKVFHYPELRASFVAWTARPDGPHLFTGTNGRTWVGDASKGPAAIKEIGSIPGSGRALSLSPEGEPPATAFYATSSLPALARLEEDNWHLLPVWLPRPLAACGQPDLQCGRQLPAKAAGSNIRALVHIPEHDVLLYALTGCTALQLLDLHNGCTRVVPRQSPIGYTANREGFFGGGEIRAAVRAPNGIWVVGGPGLFDVVHLD
jgi:hypothetical protein